MNINESIHTNGFAQSLSYHVNEPLEKCHRHVEDCMKEQVYFHDTTQRDFKKQRYGGDLYKCVIS